MSVGPDEACEPPGLAGPLSCGVSADLRCAMDTVKMTHRDIEAPSGAPASRPSSAREDQVLTTATPACKGRVSAFQRSQKAGK